MFPQISNKRILVTGGAGFIGSNLIDILLQMNNEVVCLDNFATGLPINMLDFWNNQHFTFIEGDIRNLDTCKKATDGIDYVLHQAALGSVPRSINDPITTNEVNICGFLNMITAASQAKVKRFIYAASSSTYGDDPRQPKVEENIGKPLSPYAVTKYVNELYAHVFSDIFEIETIGLRYFNVFGPHQNPDGDYAAVIPKFILKLMKYQAPLIHGDGTQSRDFTYIDNVIQANILAISTTNPQAINKVYNIALGETTSIKKLTEMIIENLAQLDAKIRNIQPQYSEKRKGDIPFSLASIEKAKQLLGYNPTVTIQEGLKKTIDWYWETYK
ncbi:MAG: SDR family oxidoreductase [Bacteroidales bacterium]